MGSLGFKYIIWGGVIALLLFIYLIIRSIYVPFLHDEVSTYLIYITSGNFWPWSAWPDANNHVLNSFAVHKMYVWFGSAPHWLRFPNVLSWILFAVSVIGISTSLKDVFFRYGFVMILFLSHGFIEFFAFARGYGMSMAFLSFSIWMIFQFHKKQSLVCASFAVLALIPMIMANLTLMPSAGMISVYVLVLWLLKFRNAKIFHTSMIALSFVAFVVVFIYAAGYSLKLKSMNLLYYGGEEGFFNAILKTHGQMLFDSVSPVLLWSIVALFVILLLGFSVQFFKLFKKRGIDPAVVFFPYLLLGSLSVILLMHFMMGVNYPEDRTSLFLYPYFIGSLFFTADLFKHRFRKLILVPLIFIPVNFIAHINTAYSFHWYYERIPVDFPVMVAQQSGTVSPSMVTISGYKIHEQIWGYHVAHSVNGVNLINPSNYPNNLDDFILLRPQEYDSMPGYFNDYEVLAEDRYSGLKLLKRRSFAERNLLFERSIDTAPFVTENEYIEFFPDTMFDFRGKSLVFEFDIQFERGYGPEGSVLVVSVRDSANNTLQYQRLETDWFSAEPMEHLKYSLSVLHIPEDADGMVVYIWNKHKKILRIKHAVLRVCEFG
jgi:hypothetical protein